MDALVNRASGEALRELLSLNLVSDYLSFLEGGSMFLHFQSLSRKWWIGALFGFEGYIRSLSV
jgi:hypothetical protein